MVAAAAYSGYFRAEGEMEVRCKGVRLGFLGKNSPGRESHLYTTLYISLAIFCTN
jgi:hypothetical protein